MTNDNIKETLRQANELLHAAFIAIKEANKDGKQFDYCTDSVLADLASSTESKAAMIHGIVYQNS